MVFISHKNDPDHGYAVRIAKKLKDSNITCWLAPESISKGQDHAVEITKAINSCEIFLLVLTENTCKSAYVRLELNFAIDHKKKIIPIKIGSFEVDDVFKYLLGNRQIKKFCFSKKSYDDLIEQCKLGERIVNMEIGKNPKRVFSLIKGSYSDNMAYLINQRPDELKCTVFAMGIDCSSDLRLSTTVGILKGVCEYLFQEFGIELETFQHLVNEAKISQLHFQQSNQEMSFKDSIVIDVPILLKNEKQEETVTLMLIANSKKKSPSSQNIDDVIGVDSREVVLKIFDHCARLEQKATNLVIGAMGTNGTGFPYEVVTAEILNCFVYAKRRSEDAKEIHYPLNLMYSVRSIDMERAGLTTDEVLSYISTSVGFFKET